MGAIVDPFPRCRDPVLCQNSDSHDIPKRRSTALWDVANTDTKLLIYGLFQKSRVLAQDDVKNHNLGFTIPYTLNGEEKNYIPDFIACIDDGRGPDDLLSLIVEVTGERKKDKAAKVTTARALWVPAINNHGGFGRWTFIEVADPWDAQNLIRGFLKQLHVEPTKEVAHG